MVLGALLGAQGGLDAVPREWIDGLYDQPRYSGLLEKLRKALR